MISIVSLVTRFLGPTGIGGFYGREEVLEMMPPYHGGGDMIETVTVDGSTWAGLPSKFEAEHYAQLVVLGMTLQSKLY